jgi:hypothetical protein
MKAGIIGSGAMTPLGGKRNRPLSLCLLLLLISTGGCAAKAQTQFSPLTITVSAPAGPPPLGAPVETSVPFPKGQLIQASGLAVVSPGGKIMPAQFRPALNWPGGSIRWLAVVFDALEGPGRYRLQGGATSAAPDLLKQQSGEIVIDTGKAVLSLAPQGPGIFSRFGAASALSSPQIGGPGVVDLVLTRYDGKEFKASLSGDSRRLVVEENGPVRASLRLEGKCRADDGEGLFDYIIRLQAYRGRPELWMTVTWINATDHPGEQLRDIRLKFPHTFSPDRLVFACDPGVYDGPWLKGWPVDILQDDYDRFRVKTRNPQGRWLNLSTGGCNGEHFPGWLYLEQGQKDSLGVLLPNFWQEYPNEFYLRDGDLEVSLWPAGAAQNLLSKEILPSNPEGTPYTYFRYFPLLPHPYLAYFDKAKRCLDAPKGLAKTQQLLLSVGNNGGGAFEKKCWGKSLAPARGFVDPVQVAKSDAVGPFWPRDREHFPKYEVMLDEAFGWFDRHIDLFKCYGKFDYGDFRYLVASSTYMCHPGTKWGDMGEMPREGYWHDNEGDTLRGLMLYYLRSGDPRAWELTQTAARHLLDVDISHYPKWGMYTHGYGHGYLAAGTSGAPDHSWLLGLMEWSGVGGDPLAWQWIKHCGDDMAAAPAGSFLGDTRSASMQVYDLSNFYLYTGDKKYLAPVGETVNRLLAEQNRDGSWPAYLGQGGSSEVGFTEHAMMGLTRYWQATGDSRVPPALQRTFAGYKDNDAMMLDPLAILYRKQQEALPAKLSAAILDQLYNDQNRDPANFSRGDTWAKWRVNNPRRAADTGRPPQLIEQTRPLMPGVILAFVPSGMEPLAKRDKLSLSDMETH